MAKPKPADIQALPELLKMLTTIRDASAGAIKMGEAVQISVDAALEEGRNTTQAHLNRVDLRPKLTYKPLPKSQHAITLGKALYYLGPKANFADIDDDQPRFYWYLDVETQTPDSIIKHDAVSLFQALLGIMQDYCNVGESPIPNS